MGWFRVEVLDKDRYGRIVGLIGTLNRELVQAGMAWVYEKYCKASFCPQWKRDEKLARQARKGLWAEDAMPPWDWRKI